MNLMHTKKFNVSVIVTFSICFFAGIVASALAQTDATTSRQQRIENRTEAVAERTQNRVALQSQRQTRIVNLCANMSNRLEALVGRLQNIAARADARIQMLAAAGKDVTEAQNSVAAAQIAISEAQTQLDTIDEKVAAFVASEDPRTQWAAVKETFVSIHKNIIAARAHLRNAVDEMKQAEAGEIATATTTPVVNEGQRDQNAEVQ
jgi:esterase/lipase